MESHPVQVLFAALRRGVSSVTMQVAVAVFALSAVLVGVLVTYGPFRDPSTAQNQTAQLPISTAGTYCAAVSTCHNPIKDENELPGTTAWAQNLPYGQEHDIEGFANPASVNVGGTVNLFVSTTAAYYHFLVFRMGYYRGLGGRLMYTSTEIEGIHQPSPITDPKTRMVSCSNWRSPVPLAIPASWVSGVYVVKLVTSANEMRYITFVVRNDASHAAIVYQSPIFTYQAYNTWGAHSLYRGAANDTVPLSQYSADLRSYVVTFDRPYTISYSLYDFSNYEYDYIRWLEREGYDVTYTTDLDTHEHGKNLLNHKLFLAGGHDEYWSTAMRQNVTAARDAGVSLAFFGANDMYWHIRVQSSPLGPDREIVCYKSASIDPLAASAPAQATVRFRDPPLSNPEYIVLGEMAAGAVSGPAALVLNDNAAAFTENTKLVSGSSLSGLVGADYGSSSAGDGGTGEYDSFFDGPSLPKGVVVIAASPVKTYEYSSASIRPVQKDVASATLYRAASGAWVFDAGTFWWSLGLDDHRLKNGPGGKFSTPDFQTFTANLLQSLYAHGG